MSPGIPCLQGRLPGTSVATRAARILLAFVLFLAAWAGPAAADEAAPRTIGAPRPIESIGQPALAGRESDGAVPRMLRQGEAGPGWVVKVPPLTRLGGPAPVALDGAEPIAGEPVSGLAAFQNAFAWVEAVPRLPRMLFDRWEPYEAAESDVPEVHFPLFLGEDEPFSIETAVRGQKPRPGRRASASMRFRADYGDDFRNDRWLSGRLLLMTRTNLGLDSEGAWRQIGRGDDSERLWTGDANLVVQLPQVTRINMRSGVGTAWIHRESRTRFGYNLTYGFDVFLRRPWLLSGEIDWGKIGGDPLLHGRITLGLVFGTMEVYTGYDYYKLDNLRIDGLIAGAGISF